MKKKTTTGVKKGSSKRAATVTANTATCENEDCTPAPKDVAFEEVEAEGALFAEQTTKTRQQIADRIHQLQEAKKDTEDAGLTDTMIEALKRLLEHAEYIGNPLCTQLWHYCEQRANTVAAIEQQIQLGLHTAAQNRQEIDAMSARINTLYARIQSNRRKLEAATLTEDLKRQEAAFELQPIDDDIYGKLGFTSKTQVAVSTLFADIKLSSEVLDALYKADEYGACGRFDDAQLVITLAVNANSQTHGSASVIGNVPLYWAQAQYFYSNGKVIEALNTQRKVVELLEQFKRKDTQTYVHMLLQIPMYNIKLNRHAKALTALQDCEESVTQLGDSALHYELLMMMSECQEHGDNLADAESNLSKVLEFIRSGAVKSPEQSVLMRLLGRLANLRYKLKDIDGTAETLRHFFDEYASQLAKIAGSGASDGGQSATLSTAESSQFHIMDIAERLQRQGGAKSSDSKTAVTDPSLNNEAVFSARKKANVKCTLNKTVESAILLLKRFYTAQKQHVASAVVDKWQRCK